MRRTEALLRRDVAARLPVGADGIVLGAEPLALDAEARNGPHAPRAALLLHGFGDAPDSLAQLGAVLHARGWTVRAPLLPGHGRTLDAFAASTAADWLAAAGDAYAALRATHAEVALVGQSMGGALSVLLAAERPPPRLVLLAPYLAVPPLVRTIGRLHPLAARLTPWLRSRSDASILDPAARQASRGYGVVAPHLLRELTRVVDQAVAALPRVSSPTRVIHSRRDNRIAPAAAAAAFARLGATQKELVWLDASGHVISVDREKARVFTLVADWLGPTASMTASPRPP